MNILLQYLEGEFSELAPGFFQNFSAGPGKRVILPHLPIDYLILTRKIATGAELMKERVQSPVRDRIPMFLELIFQFLAIKWSIARMVEDVNLNETGEEISK